MLCSGKVAYDLIDARDKAGDTQTAIVRVEQLYPFPGEPLVARLKRMTDLEEVVWAQEEPKNNGSWSFVEPFIEQCLIESKVKPQRAALCRPRRRGVAGDRPCQAARGGAGGADRRRAWPRRRGASATQSELRG